VEEKGEREVPLIWAKRTGCAEEGVRVEPPLEKKRVVEWCNSAVPPVIGDICISLTLLPAPRRRRSTTLYHPVDRGKEIFEASLSFSIPRASANEKDATVRETCSSHSKSMPFRDYLASKEITQHALLAVERLRRLIRAVCLVKKAICNRAGNALSISAAHLPSSTRALSCVIIRHYRDIDLAFFSFA